MLQLGGLVQTAIFDTPNLWQYIIGRQEHKNVCGLVHWEHSPLDLYLT